VEFHEGKSYTHERIASIQYVSTFKSERAMKRRNGGGSFRCGNLMFPRRLELVRLKQKALRRSVWYKVLSRIERSLIDLAIRVVAKVRSVTLARSVAFVVKKLVNVFETSVQRQIQTIGLPLARRLSAIAQNWGNALAVHWASDLGFARFLAICVVGMSG
jgi:hypothetical protein